MLHAVRNGDTRQARAAFKGIPADVLHAIRDSYACNGATVGKRTIADEYDAIRHNHITAGAIVDFQHDFFISNKIVIKKIKKILDRFKRFFCSFNAHVSLGL